ncbi:coenzyme A pyrophosphatase [Halalkalibacillus sediminis]|uniref:Coenzyme A pyrophosphatase n=1 Tax=Halalkalibacillus sediminis TaxID=2018042 RepID=A0A2I0QXT7_9BACI|nr:CoA pyrophosphatase [Halalkalibacillus sediminis]PKR79154.1 coenzyme A pyrophosphatase [Halalkalibacillus sediminis]
MNRVEILEKINNHQPSILGLKNARNYSILLPLAEKNEELHIVFEIRSKDMRRQPGEVCFPGGKVDKEDQREEDTAIRELSEELGIGWNQISDLQSIGVLVSPFGMKVHAHVGFIEDMSPLELNPAEVEDIFTVPLNHFLKTDPEVHYINFDVRPEDGFPYEDIANGESYQWQSMKYEEHFYYYNDQVIWGLTARIIRDFIDLIK